MYANAAQLSYASLLPSHRNFGLCKQSLGTFFTSFLFPIHAFRNNFYTGLLYYIAALYSLVGWGDCITLWVCNGALNMDTVAELYKAALNII